jgi:hypothetical protein
MTGRNPNVFYEVGYAHALGKRVLLLTQKADDIPFDLKHYPHIVYGGKITELKQELEKRVRWAFEHPKEFKKLSNEQIQIFIEGQRIINRPQFMIKTQGSVVYLNLVVDIHNSTENTIEATAFEVGIISDGRLRLNHVHNGSPNSSEKFTTRTIVLSEQTVLYIVDNTFQVLPGSWDKIAFYFIDDRGHLCNPGGLEFVLRLFTEVGPVDYPFVFKAEAEKK